MTAKETIAHIKQLLFGEQNPPAPIEGTKYKLADGTEVTIDKLEIGGKVMIGDQAAPDGEHTLEDGTSITVTGGAITEIAKPDNDEPPAPLETPEMMKAELKKFLQELFEKNMEEVFNKHKAAFEKQEQIIANQKEAITKLTELVEQIAEEPADDKVEDQPEWENMTPLQRFRKQKQMFNQN